MSTFNGLYLEEWKDLGNKSMESEDLLYTSLSPDHAIVTTGSHGGFKVFSLQPFALISESLEGNFKIVEIYEGPSLLILVGAGEQPAYSPRRLSVWNCSTRETICETRFEESVLSVRTNKIRITVATIDKVFIYNTSTMKTLTVLPTADNPKGLQALSPSHSDCFLIFPASEDRGLVQVYDCFNMQSRSVIEAHNSRLAYLSISNQGHLLATASMKGTMMRVFTLPEGKKLFTFKRGIIPAEIYSIFFFS
jgi:autophagy-related protein 18